MDGFRYRTEDISPDEILPLFVATELDRQIVDSLKSSSPTILEGSRGVGKSFLLRVAEAELLKDFDTEKCLPVYISFVQSTLIHTADPRQFEHWILAKITGRLLRTLKKAGLLRAASASLVASLGSDESTIEVVHDRLNVAVQMYERSYQSPNHQVDSSAIPSVDQFKETVEDLCTQLRLRRVVFLFDEAAHVFIPRAQRAFFTLFRDLRCPWASCNAAVYPGVTSYGDAFQPTHDATFVRINRDIHSSAYIDNMREIVEKQATSSLLTAIEKNRTNFATLAYAVNGNPRMLLKTIERVPRLTSSQVSSVIKDFYRNDIWSEHSGLADRYPGHREIIDWGRNFIEDTVIPETKAKNDGWREEGRTESTCYFWVHRDAPEAVREALRLLSYTGIVETDASGIRTTRSEIGTRYALNLGCLFAQESNPASTAPTIFQRLTRRRFTEFGANHPKYLVIEGAADVQTSTHLFEALQEQLQRNVEVLDLTRWQIERLKERGFTEVGQVLTATEEQLRESHYVGPVRARQMINSAVASVFEYLSG